MDPICVVQQIQAKINWQTSQQMTWIHFIYTLNNLLRTNRSIFVFEQNKKKGILSTDCPLSSNTYYYSMHTETQNILRIK